MQPLIKKQPPKVQVEVIKKGPLVDTLTSSLFSIMEADTKDEGKGKLSSIVAVHLIVVC